jgi:hypothetical protein
LAQTSEPSSPAEITRHSRRAISTRVVAPAEINIGQLTEVKLVATNEGDEDTGPFNLVLYIPGDVEFAQANPAPADQTGSMAIWRMQGLAAGDSSEVNFQLVPQVRQPMNLKTELIFVDRHELEIAVRQPEVRMQVASLDKAIVGEVVEHRLTIWNEGDGPAEQLELQVSLPPETELLEQASDRIRIGSLAAGDSRELVLRTRSGIDGPTPLRWDLTGQGIELAEASQVAVIWPELYAELLGPKLNIPGREGTYTVNLNNPCEIDIHDTRVTLRIPAGMEITLLSRDGEVDERQRTITWKLGTLSPGVADSLQFRARLVDSRDQTCHVEVESQETRSSQLALETRAYNHTELKLAMKNVSGPVNIGDTAEFLIVAANAGRTVAEGVDIQVEYPEWLEPLESDAYVIDHSQSRLVFQSVDIAEGQQAELRFAGRCVNAGNFVVRSLLSHGSQPQPMISDAGLFVLDIQHEKVGSLISPDKSIR